MRGESHVTTARRLRLQRAADRLANGVFEVANIATQTGYADVPGFTRALRQAHCTTPAGYRENGSHSRFKKATAAIDATAFPVSVEGVEGADCAAVHHHGSYMQIDRAMSRLLNALGAAGLLTGPPALMATFFDDPDDPDVIAETDLRSAVCVAMARHAELPKGVEFLAMRGGLAAILSYRGSYADMKDAYRWLYGVWLPRSGFDPDNAPCIERYLNDPTSAAPSDLETEIVLPLRGGS